MAKKASASKKVTAKKPAKPAVKAAKATKKVASVKTATKSKAVAKVATKPIAKAPAKAAPPVKQADKQVKIAPEKPALMTKKGKIESEESRDQGDMLIEKAKEEMAAINNNAKVAEAKSKIKPIKIERGNAADEKAKWQELYKRYGKEKAVVYKMTEAFDALKPLQHKVLGWGFVLSNENNRLEVLFENGIKMLISNYKPS